MRMIDLDDSRHCFCGDMGEYENWNIDPDIPTIDAVEVVRCKDCKHRQEDTIFHKLYCDGREVVADGYCWKGEQDD